MSTEPTQTAYTEPAIYDLEHAAEEPDIAFFVGLARRWRPQRVLEIGCGNGRVTLPVAAAIREWGGRAQGLELFPEMLAAARVSDVHGLVEWTSGDLRTWRTAAPVELLISPCGSLGHLLSLEDQLCAWRTAHANLAPGGRFVVSEPMANLPAIAESMRSPARAVVELDLDHSASSGRLLRYRTTRYEASEQTAAVHYLYDRFEDSGGAERLVSNYDGHVYFPRELQLLFLAAGFSVEAVWGDHRERPLRHADRQIVVVGRRA